MSLENNMLPQYFGKAEKGYHYKDTTTIVNGGGHKEAIENRAFQFIKNQYEASTKYFKEAPV